MHISDNKCIWMTGKKNEQFISDDLKELFLKFSSMKSRPKDTYDGWINKELFFKNTILHIRGGSGWCYHKEEYHNECVKLISTYILR